MEELNESLKRTNETLDRIIALQINLKEQYPDIFKQNKTILALEYLRKTNPNNKYTSVFQDEVYNKWIHPPDLVIYGLIYDETENIFYIVESNKTEETLEKFSQFIRMDKPPIRHCELRRWSFFFDKECGIVSGNKERTTATIFLTP